MIRLQVKHCRMSTPPISTYRPRDQALGIARRKAAVITAVRSGVIDIEEVPPV